ncbi:AAA family ATPase [Bacillus anthracis]|uniref:AAA family ATPase n=1 Tax=Bacillus anthracis TaxID=1392 RepID=UPI0011172549|nr:AAA family ATPase [Bacillus anthracis]
MQENLLYLKFKDAKGDVTFDLNQNTVFFGNNGKGKTRILKTIDTLYKLDKERKLGTLSKLIDDMNLKDLKIDGVSYKKLFSENEDLIQIQERNIFNYIKKNSDFFFLLEEILDSLHFDIKYPNKIVNNQLNLIKRCADISRPSEVRQLFGKPESFKLWLNDLELFIRNIKHDFLHINNFEKDNIENKYFLNNIEQASTIISYLIKEFYLVNLEGKNKSLVHRINELKTGIINNLFSNSAYYITTENIDITLISKKVEILIDKINEDLQKAFWDSNKVLEIEGIFEQRNKLYSKIDIFNKTMRKYGEIEIAIQNKTELVFLKAHRTIDFDKLSSGERKVSFLFLEIIFNEVDIYLIDEPELSLSLNYQNKIVTDLYVLTKNKKIFIATHAPFIYEDFKSLPGSIVKEVE